MERIPLFKLGEFILVTIQVDLHDKLVMTLQNDIAEEISKSGARGILVDISTLDIVDSFVGRMLANVGAVARVLGAETVVVGMQPAVAITLVELGMTLEGVHTALNTLRGMELLRSLLGSDNDNHQV
jgi:rsbT antagonist protein RsbS